MATLEQELDALMETPRPTAAQAAKVIQRHMKRVRDWPGVLRRLADYIEQRPRPIEISHREVVSLVRESLEPNGRTGQCE